MSVAGHVLDGKYRIERTLGEGGMGSVFLARHLGTDRPVALKVIAGHLSASAEAMDRFRAEAVAAGRLRHPNVVDVTDFGIAGIDGRRVAYLVMEYLDGQTLAALLEKEGRLPLSFSVDVLEQICSAMSEAHGIGIVHRDLKPENVWLEPNRRGGHTVKVLDFGIAKLSEGIVVDAPAVARDAPPPGDDGLPVTRPLAPAELGISTPGAITRDGAIIGTPHYMSPEQWRGEPLDGRSDIYAVGVIAYRMLSGKLPFDGAAIDLMRQHLDRQPSAEPLREARVPAAIVDLVLACLAKAPAGRPRSAAELAVALRARSEGIGILLRRVLALGSEHLPSFLRISAIAHLPAMAMLILTVLGSFARTMLEPPRPFATVMAVTPYVLFFATGLFATSFSSGVFVPVLARVTTRPLAAVPVMPLLLAMRPLRYRLMRTGVLFYLAALPSKLVFLVPVVWLQNPGTGVAVAATFVLVVASAYGARNTVRYAFHPHPVMLEGLSGWRALRRSAVLAGRARRLIPGAVLFLATAVVFDVMALATCFLIVGGLQLCVARAVAEGSLLVVPMILAAVGFIALSIVMNPLLSLTFALTYLRTRQADAEPLPEILGEDATA